MSEPCDRLDLDQRSIALGGQGGVVRDGWPDRSSNFFRLFFGQKFGASKIGSQCDPVTTFCLSVGQRNAYDAFNTKKLMLINRI
jgi:hypothetical protein